MLPYRALHDYGSQVLLILYMPSDGKNKLGHGLPLVQKTRFGCVSGAGGSLRLTALCKASCFMLLRAYSVERIHAQALRRYRSLERKLDFHLNLRTQYASFIEE